MTSTVFPLTFIEQMIVKANGAGDTVWLECCVAIDGVNWQAAILSVDSNTVTLESDWAVFLQAIAPTLDEAIKQLDAICAKDFQ